MNQHEWEHLLSADAALRASELPHARAGIKSLISKGEMALAGDYLRRLISIHYDYSELLALYKTYSKWSKVAAPQKCLKISVLGSYTYDAVARMLELFLYQRDVWAQVEALPFGNYESELMRMDSGFHEGECDAVLFLMGVDDLRFLPNSPLSETQARQAIENEWARMEQLWDCASRGRSVLIIQNTLDAPVHSWMGGLDRQTPGTPQWHVDQLNQRLRKEANDRSKVLLHEQSLLSAYYGRRMWYDRRYHFDAKLPQSPDYAKYYAQSLASLLAATLGRTRKCLVLDFDNTLWGGVAADEGINGVKLGQGDAVGEAFLSFQKYCLSLSRSGILLAGCSKNDAGFIDAFLKDHPEQVLRKEAFSALRVNWKDKASNLREIAKELNIGLDALVFFDDNPAERALVRQMLPAVLVPDVPLDASDFPEALLAERPFERIALTEEDRGRAQSYAQQREREALRVESGDMKSYLKSLGMKASVEAVGENNFQRVTQLINKTNQFNLMTERQHEDQVRERAQSPEWVCFALRLRDRFGDHGLIAVVQAHVGGHVLGVKNWLMSCRVLERGVEALTLSLVVREARKRGCDCVLGYYVPTKKNARVASLYASMGFVSEEYAQGGVDVWRLAIDSDKATWDHFIDIEKDTL